MKFIQRSQIPESLINLKPEGLKRNNKTLINELKKEFNNKCAYCETYIKPNEKNVIDHFYPKSSYPNKILDWNNLFLCCSECNSIKRDINPIDKNNKHIIVDTRNIFL